MSPKKEEIRKRCVLSWLKIRRDWCHLLHVDHGWIAISTGNWRTFLHAPSTPDTKVSVTFQSAWGVTPADIVNVSPTWYGEQVKENDVDNALCREISWQLARLGFRLELLTVDSIIVRRTGDKAQDIAAQRLHWVNKILGNSMMADISTRPYTNVGLAAVNIHDRVEALEAFRQLMQGWPNLPVDVGDVRVPMVGMEEVDLERIERAIARFYVETFVKHAGRAPVLLLRGY